MSTLHSFTLEMAQFAKDLDTMGKAAPLIMARSLNRAGVSGQSAMVRAVSDDTGIAAKNVKREIVLDKATRTNPVVALSIAGRRIPLIAFRARGPEPSRGKGRGVSYRLPGSAGRIPNAFIATVGTGAHRGVFKRRGKKRLPIMELRGPSLPHVFERKVEAFRVAAQESFLKNLAHEISFARSKQGGGSEFPLSPSGGW